MSFERTNFLIDGLLSGRVDWHQVCFRHLKGDDVNTLNYKELMSLEDALECGLVGIRQRQANLISIYAVI